MTAMLQVTDAAKTFTMHLQGGIRLPVVAGVSFDGASGRMRGAVRSVGRRKIVDPEDHLRQLSLRSRARSPCCIRATSSISRRPSRATSSACARPPSATSASFCARCRGCRRSTWWPSRWSPAACRARRRASAPATLLRRLNIPERLWTLPPSTFSGGEQQRVNIARGFLPDLPLLLLDEPTASLDAANRAVVVDTDRGEEAQRRRRWSRSSMTTTCARKSPTGLSMSRNSPRQHDRQA